MTGLNLELRQSGSIELPSWLAESSLSLNEIGAVVVIACLQERGGADAIGKRMNSEDCIVAMKSLVDKAILMFDVAKGDSDSQHATLKFLLDLEIVNPNQDQ